MTEMLHRRTLTGVLLLWSAYMTTWTVLTGAGPAMVALWWLVGAAAFGALWLVTQPLGGVARRSLSLGLARTRRGP